MKCKSCNEDMNGDGYTSAYVCPNMDDEDPRHLEAFEPDASPQYCESASFPLSTV